MHNDLIVLQVNIEKATFSKEFLVICHFCEESFHYINTYIYRKFKKNS